MVTLIKYGALGGGEKYNVNQMWIDGLSTDTKPTTTIDGMPIPNGSVYTEVDTGKTYMFDKDNTVWYEVSLGGGGGGTSDYTDLSNKPKINNVELSGNKSSSDLSLQDKIDSNNKLAGSLSVLTGYTAGTSTVIRSIAETDTVNEAIQKLENNDSLDRNDILTIQGKLTAHTAGGSNYDTINGIRVYVSSTAPTGDIPTGSLWIGG